jgi:hypothetical protein
VDVHLIKSEWPSNLTYVLFDFINVLIDFIKPDQFQVFFKIFIKNNIVLLKNILKMTWFGVDPSNLLSKLWTGLDRGLF